MFGLNNLATDQPVGDDLSGVDRAGYTRAGRFKDLRDAPIERSRRWEWFRFQAARTFRATL